MRYSLTALLVIIASTLGSITFLHHSEGYKKKMFQLGARVKINNYLFSRKDLAQVTHISLIEGKGLSAELKYHKGVWYINKPWEDRADARIVNLLIQFTSMLKVRDVVSIKSTHTKELGLQKGKFQIKMKNDKGVTLANYSIGRTSAWRIKEQKLKTTGSTLFIQLANKKQQKHIYVCSDISSGTIHRLFGAQFAQFRDHRPFSFNKENLKKIRLQEKGNEVILSKKNQKSKWKITKPLELDVDNLAMNKLLDDLNRLSAIKLTDRAGVTLPTREESASQQSEIALQKVNSEMQITLKIFPAQKENNLLVLGMVSDRPETVFYLPFTNTGALNNNISLSQLTFGVNDLRSKTLTPLNIEDIKTILIKQKSRSNLILEKNDSGSWYIEHFNRKRPANKLAIKDLLKALTEDRVEKFVTDSATDLRPYGLDNPILQIALIDTKGAGTRIAFGKNSSQKITYAHIPGSGNIVQVSDTTLSRISTYPWQWQDSNIWHISKIDIKKIFVIKNREEILELEYAYFLDKWKSKVAGKDRSADLNPNRASRFLDILESLQTTKWLGPLHPQASEALKKPDTEIQIRLIPEDHSKKNNPPIITKILKIAHTGGNLIHFAKVDTIPKNASSEKENSYFLLDTKTLSRLTMDLFK